MNKTTFIENAIMRTGCTRRKANFWYELEKDRTKLLKENFYKEEYKKSLKDYANRSKDVKKFISNFSKMRKCKLVEAYLILYDSFYLSYPNAFNPSQNSKSRLHDIFVNGYIEIFTEFVKEKLKEGSNELQFN